ncbi:MAG: response regulator [Magnetococcales bacterium]|nr:response regulator [Magnetococcales bacterium]
MTDPIRVMVVDDEAEIRHAIERYLAFQTELQDLVIIQAGTFEEALTRLEEQSPLIVLQDINLPDGNGLQFIRQTKKKYPMVQFIVITGASDLDRAMEALVYGAADYIKKPLDMPMLATVIGQAVNRCRRWGELLWAEYSETTESMDEIATSPAE